MPAPHYDIITEYNMSYTANNRGSLYFLVAVVVALGVAACVQSTTPAATQPTAGAVVGTPGPVAASYAAPELGIVVDEKMQVVNVESNSAAEEAGVQVGDLLQSLDGVAFATDMHKVKEVVGYSRTIDEAKGQYAPADKSLQLLLVRKGETMTLSIIPAGPGGRPDGPTPTPVWPPYDRL